MNLQAMQRATQTAEQVYKTLLDQVVDDRILNDRVGPLSEKQQHKIHQATHVDVRTIRLMSISGKGGPGHPEFTNVTLLDHLLSVVRGSMLFAALDWLTLNEEMEQQLLERQLAVIASIALLHDLDKDLGLARNQPIELDMLSERMTRYGIDSFLQGYSLHVSPGAMRYLIEKVEGTQAHRQAAAELPPRDFEPLPGYVRLADKLDGAWLSLEPEKGGINGVMARLRKGSGCLHTEPLSHWRTIDLFDPHHPFLVDELQRWLSIVSRRITGIPPLIETHQDGRLLMLLPASQAKDIIHQGLKFLARKLPFRLELVVSNRGRPLLQGTRPDYPQLCGLIAEEPAASLARLFYIAAPLKSTITAPLDHLLQPWGLQVSWPKKTDGLISPFSDPGQLADADLNILQEAAQLALLLNLNIKIKNDLPSADDREAALPQVMGETPPEWISTIENDLSRRNLTALWCRTQAEEYPERFDAIWGNEGLLAQWLEGRDEQPGLADYIEGKGGVAIQAVQQHFEKLLQGEYLAPAQEHHQGRCLFTNEPVPLGERIDSASGLYGVKISAFSGRDGRPEGVDKPSAHTNVGLVSQAEYRLRSEAHKAQGGKDDGIPLLVSSPTTSGLFAGLLTTDEKLLPGLSLYDLSRQERKKGKTYRGTELYRSRYRIARLERLADRSEMQVDQLRLFLQTSLRLGRPLHLFRGLPTHQAAFFYFDALPSLLGELIGSQSLRLEEIPQALHRLELAHTLLSATGLGYDALRLYANPRTRLSGIAHAWCELTDRDSTASQVIRQLATEFRSLSLETCNMNDTAGPFVRLGRLAAPVQRYVPGGASANRQMMIFKIGLDALQIARAAGQEDRASLIAAIAGELEQNLLRRDEARPKGGKLVAACIEIAELLTDDIWTHTLHKKMPSQNQQRVLGNIYRLAFYQAQREEYEKKQAETDLAD